MNKRMHLLRPAIGSSLFLSAAMLAGQDASGLIQSLKSMAQGGGLSSLGLGTTSAIPDHAAPNVLDQMMDPQQVADDLRLDDEIKQLKAKERGPRRFASDLFDVRQRKTALTEGGVSEDYILGTGDRLNISGFGSAAFDVAVQVDSRGVIVVPKIGVVKIGGKPLGDARHLIEQTVKKQFSTTTVDVQTLKLREVRVFVMGEVYKSGSYVVPSLSSLVNVLSLAGGPNSNGSYRQIKVIRGGKAIHTLDLYPLRAEGMGDMSFYLENGDTIFVPLGLNQVLLEGAFTRVVAAATKDHPREEPEKGSYPNEPKEQRDLRRQIQHLEDILGLTPPDNGSGADSGLGSAASLNGIASLGNGPLGALATGLKGQLATNQQSLNNPPAFGQGQNPGSTGVGSMATGLGLTSSMKTGLLASALNNQINASGNNGLQQAQPAVPMSLQDQMQILTQLDALKDQLHQMKITSRGDFRIPDPDAANDETTGQPDWLTRWQQEGSAPAMQFEMLPGETAADALKYAGGFDIQGFAGRLTLRRMDADGAWNGQDVALIGAKPIPEMQRGDILTALPRRDYMAQVVRIEGWVRIPGVFSVKDGFRVGDLLKREDLILPDTYLGRGEITRTLPDGTTKFISFDVSKALSGEEAQNVLLQGRDRVDLYKADDLRLQRTLTVVGPVQRPGVFEFHEGMRASDLLFRAGVPQRSADRFVAELSHVRDGKRFDVKRVDLTKLLSTETASPVELKDDVANPPLEPFDQLSIFAKPDFRPMRSVTLTGQVNRPGVYTLDNPRTTLKELVERAGGLTADAMPKAAIFLRQMGQVDPDKAKAAQLAGIQPMDPTSNGINETLGRLNETMRNPLSGGLLTNPVLHGLQSGSLSRLVVDMPSLLSGEKSAELDLQDGDEVIFPIRTDVAYVVGEAASPFAAYKVRSNMTVTDLIERAGGTTRNADRGAIRLLKADGQIVDSWLSWRKVEPGDAVLIPQRIRRDVTWQENLAALTPLAIMINAVKK